MAFLHADTPKKPLQRLPRIFGYVSIFFVIVCWIGQSEAVQAVETSTYNRPYIITYINHSLGMLQGLFLLRGRDRSSASEFFQKDGRVMWKVLGICIAYQLAGYVCYIGLAGTSVADGTIIFQSMSVFVFIFEWLLGRRRASLWIGLAVIVSLLGVVLVAYKPGANNVQTGCVSQLGGNVLVLIGAMLYAVYQVSLDTLLPSSDAALTNAFVALSGFVTLTTLWPVALLLPFAPQGGCLFEPLDLPDPVAALGLALTGFLAFLFNVFFCFSIILTSPLTTAVGCMLTVPASLLADFVLHGDPIGFSAICGSTLVLAGFLVIARQTDETQN